MSRPCVFAVSICSFYRSAGGSLLEQVQDIPGCGRQLGHVYDVSPHSLLTLLTRKLDQLQTCLEATCTEISCSTPPFKQSVQACGRCQCGDWALQGDRHIASSLHPACTSIHTKCCMILVYVVCLAGMQVDVRWLPGASSSQPSRCPSLSSNIPRPTHPRQRRHCCRGTTHLQSCIPSHDISIHPALQKRQLSPPSRMLCRPGRDCSRDLLEEASDQRPGSPAVSQQFLRSQKICQHVSIMV